MCEYAQVLRLCYCLKCMGSVHVRACVYVSVYMYVYVCTCVCVRACVYVSVYMYVYVCTCVCVRACVYVSVYMYVYVCTCVCVRVCVYVSVYTYVYVCTCVCVRAYQSWECACRPDGERYSGDWFDGFCCGNCATWQGSLDWFEVDLSALTATHCNTLQHCAT